MNPCWIWLGAQNEQGYGVRDKKENESTRYVHRIIWEEVTGLRLGKYHLHHRCHNKLCYNPSHLTPLDPCEHSQLHAVKKPHCLRGHSFDPPNGYIKTNGDRACRACRSILKSRHWRSRTPEQVVLSKARSRRSYHKRKLEK